MVPMLTHLSECAAFEPDAIAAMSRALDEACDALVVSPADERGRQTLAVRIIDLARTGVADPAALRDRVVHEVHALESD